MSERYTSPTNKQLGKFVAVCIAIGSVVGLSTELSHHVDAKHDVPVATACVEGYSAHGKLTQKAIDCVTSRTSIGLDLQPGMPAVLATGYIEGESAANGGFNLASPLSGALEGGAAGVGLIVIGAMLGAFGRDESDSDR